MSAAGLLRRRLESTAYAWPALAAVALLLLVNGAADPSFVSPGNWASTVGVLTPFVLVSVAQVPTVLSGNGGLDLSVGPLAALVSSVVAAKLAPAGVGQPYVVIPAALGMGAAAGLINGTLVAVLRIPAIVATLGTYLSFGALALIVLPTEGGTAPHWLAQVAGAVIGPIPGTLLMIAIIGVAWTTLFRTAYRRNLLAVGGDARAAFTAGIPVTATRLLAYVASGVLAAVAGLGFVAVLAAADPTIGPQYTLISLAGVALGGVSLAGGRGGILGAAAGGSILFLIQNTLGLFSVSAFYTQIAYGVALVIALATNSAADVWRRRARAPLVSASAELEEAASVFSL